MTEPRPGAPGADIRLHVSSPYAVSLPAHAPGALGLARAYVTGDLDISGDMYTALTTGCSRRSRSDLRATSGRSRGVLRDPLLRAARAEALDPPPQEAPSSGAACRGCGTPSAATPRRSRHHYDVSNTFYEWVLGPSMAYTCACYPTEDATLEQAQYNKFDLVARKLGLRAGHAAARRRLRLGRHGACTPRSEYGVKALGVTLSKQQARVGAEGDRARGPVRPRRGASPRLPRRHRDAGSTRSARSASPSTSGKRNSRRTSRSCTASCARAGGCSTTPSPVRTTASRAPQGRRSSTGTCSPTASSRVRLRSSPRCTTPGSRSATRRTCASTTR